MAAPQAAQNEAILAKYLTDSIRAIEQTIRKATPPGAVLPRAVSAPRLDPRPHGRRAATEVLLPRKLPYAQAGHVAATQARLLQAGQLGAGSGGGGVAQVRSSGGHAAGTPPRPPAVVRTVAAAGGDGAGRQPAAAAAAGGGVRASSAPRLEDAVPSSPHKHHQHHYHHAPPQPTRSEARVPAVTAAVAAAARGGGGGAAAVAGAAEASAQPAAARGPSDARSSASFARGAPSDTGTNASWWRKPTTDASYPLTAITDRYAKSMTPTELVKWNDRVARLEAEVTAEKERRRHFEEELRKLQAATSTPQQQPRAVPFR